MTMQLIEQHPAISSIAAYMVFNAFVAGMPTPPPGAKLWYRWLHTSLNVLAVNVGELARSRFPQTPQLSPGTRYEATASLTVPPDTGPITAGQTGEGKTPSL